MTEQEAKNYWEEFLGEIEGLKRSNSSVDWEAQEQATRKAINALEKQIPKKPTIESQCDGNAFSDWNRWYCPVCHNSLGVTNHPRKDGYCDKCGQKLDWE